MKSDQAGRAKPAAGRRRRRRNSPAANGLNFEDFATGWPCRPDEANETDDDALRGLADLRAGRMG